MNDPKFTFLDTSHIKVNKDFKVTLHEYGKEKHPILSLDNFLENPQDVVDIISKHPFPERNKLNVFHPGWRIPCKLEFEDIKNAITQVCDHYYKLEDYIKNDTGRELYIDIQFNLYQGGTPCMVTSILPHVDQAFIACNLHLNPDEENMGGTDFYTHVRTGLQADYSYIFGDKFKQTQKYMLLKEEKRAIWFNNYETIHDDFELEKRSDQWKKEFTVEAKFNRLNIYPAYLFHAVGMKKEWYLNNKRYSLVAAVT